MIPATDWGKWALGYGALWALLLLLVESGGGDLAAALAVTVAGGMTVIAGDKAFGNLGFGGKAHGR